MLQDNFFTKLIFQSSYKDTDMSGFKLAPSRLNRPPASEDAVASPTTKTNFAGKLINIYLGNEASLIHNSLTMSKRSDRE